MWDRLSEQARAVMDLALAESEQLGHGYVGDEHVLLGLLRDQASPAASLLRGHGLDLARARAELQRLWAAGLMPRSRTDDAGALRAVGIDVEAVRQRLVTAFGEQAVGAAVWTGRDGHVRVLVADRGHLPAGVAQRTALGRAAADVGEGDGVPGVLAEVPPPGRQDDQPGFGRRQHLRPHPQGGEANACRNRVC